MRSRSLHDASELLNELVSRTGEPGDLTGMLQCINQTARTFFHADTCNIFASNPITGHFIEPNTVTNPITGDFIEPYTVAGKLLKYRRESPGRPSPGGLTERVLKRGMLLVRDVETAPEYQSTFTHLEGIRSFVGLALLTRYTKKPLAVLYLNFRQAQEFTLDEQELFQIFASQASFMLQETWLLLRYQEVARIGKEINQELGTVTTLFEKLRKYVGNILDTSHALLLKVYQPGTGTLDSYLEEEGRFIFHENSPLQGASRYVIETKQMLSIQQLSKEHLPTQPLHIEGTGTEESLIFVPLVLRDVSLGVLSIQHPQMYHYNQEDLFIINLLANHISLALHNIRLYSSLNQLNEAGQTLTQLLESEKVLDATADKILEATKADLVVLYPYEPTFQRFALPPRIAGTLLNLTIESMSPDRPDDLPALMLRQPRPIFAKTSAAIYTDLHSDIHIRQGSFGQREKLRSTAAVPLRVGDDTVGVLFVNFRQPQRFDDPQKLFIEGLAHYAAIAIKNAQEFGTLIHRRMRELEILQDIDRELTRSLDLEAVLHALLKLANEHIHAEGAAIMLYNPQTQVLGTPAAIGYQAEERSKLTISLLESRGITRWVLENKKSAKVDNVHSDHPWSDFYIPAADNTIAELDVPLIDGEEVIGVLNFESSREGAFRQEDQDFLVTLAGQAVLAIKNAQAYEREKRLVAEAQVLNEVSKEITSQLDPAHVFDLILEKALELTHSTLGSLHLYDVDRRDLSMAAERGVAEDKEGQRQRLDQGVVGYVARNKHLLNVADVSQHPWNEVYLKIIPRVNSELAVPMLAGDDLLGVLNVESPNPNNFSERDERLLQGLADMAVVALQNAQAYEREKRLVAEGQLLNEISKEITSQLDPAHIFNLILEKALELTHSMLGELLLYDPDRNDLGTVAARGIAEDKKSVRLSLQQGIVGYVARNKQLINADLSQPTWKLIHVEFVPGMCSELAVPMLAGDDLRGVLYVESSVPNNFSESDERLLQGLADMAVVALQNAQAYEREKRLLREAQVLNEVSKEITSKLDLANVFALILKKALELTHSTLGALMVYDPDRNDLWMAAEHGADDKKDLRLSLSEGIVGYVARTKQPLNIDPSQSPWNKFLVEFTPGTRSELAVPMLALSELRGVLNVESLLPNNFSESDETLLKGLADLAVVALQNAELYEKAERELQHFQLLYQAAQELGKITELANLEQAYSVILQIAEKHSQSQVVIRSYDADSEELVLVCASHYQNVSPFPRMRLDEGLNGQVARERRTIVIYDTNNPPSSVVSLKLSDPATQSVVIIPIKFKDYYYGNLGLSHKDVGYFRGTDIEFFEGLAQELANTLYRLQTTQARQEFEQRALSAEEMSSVGQSAFELTHRLSNDLGLVESYVSDIQFEVETLGITSEIISRKLNNIVKAARTVLDLSGALKRELTRSGSIEEEAGGPVIVPPRVLLEEVLAMVTLPSGIELSLKIDDDVAEVRAVRGLVIDILRNLLVNAIEAMPGGGRITLSARNATRFVLLEVSDTGVGIPEEKQSKVFDLFFSSKGSSGFGLWSARRNALRNRGDLRIQSQPGLGTTFTLLLPKEEIMP